MLIKYNQILIIYIPFFSVLADLSRDILQSMLVVEYKNISTENSRFSWKIPIFSNFDPLVRARDIKISEKLFDIFKTHIKGNFRLPLLVGWEEKNFPMGIRCTLEGLCYSSHKFKNRLAIEILICSTMITDHK